MNEMMNEEQKDFFNIALKQCNEVIQKYMSKKELTPAEQASIVLELQQVSEKLSNPGKSNAN